MKANEFVKKFGVERAKQMVNADDSVHALVFATTKVSFLDLKCLIESYELVSEFFNLEALGFDKAIELAKKQIEELEDNETVEFWHRWDDDLSCTVARMKQAIADVESCQ